MLMVAETVPFGRGVGKKAQNGIIRGTTGLFRGHRDLFLKRTTTEVWGHAIFPASNTNNPVSCIGIVRQIKRGEVGSLIKRATMMLAIITPPKTGTSGPRHRRRATSRRHRSGSPERVLPEVIIGRLLNDNASAPVSTTGCLKARTNSENTSPGRNPRP